MKAFKVRKDGVIPGLPWNKEPYPKEKTKANEYITLGLLVRRFSIVKKGGNP